MNSENVLGLCVAAVLLLCIPTKSDFESDVLISHNIFRIKHGCPIFYLDDDFSTECKKYAELAKEEALKHSAANGTYGENLCYTTDQAELCVQMWYDEVKDYDFDKAEYSPATRHFTQLIWKATESLGVGQATSSSGRHFVVARYKPAGNTEGKFKENVPRALSFGHSIHTSKYFTLFSWLFPALPMQTF
ncbi:uncharacterized protein Dvir_GJ10085, isoform D [Drosophila virilis]|uniref:Uncharacterized protein, isoform D n=1 Tax=Drosophila virilis TaxID=7244 RepID=A0A0Q9WDQ6_DROVI|nr:uncharacterized protein Dvir_GJ10085, isoform D [Drosophila virilis]